jgi:hypothetical protein
MSQENFAGRALILTYFTYIPPENKEQLSTVACGTRRMMTSLEIILNSRQTYTIHTIVHIQIIIKCSIN